MKALRKLLPTLALAALAWPLAPPAEAQPPIIPGVDLLETSVGTPTFINFAGDPIPAGFFCPGSAPFTGIVGLAGVPLTTLPPGVAGNADTVIERLTPGNFVGGVATIDVVVRALQLAGTDIIEVTCDDGTVTRWQVNACLCGLQPRTKIQVKVDQPCGCGHFDGSLRLRICLTFTNVDTGETRGPIARLITLRIAGTPWCPRPGAGTPTISESFAVDTNCDGQPDLTLKGTTNFFPGWDCHTQASDCWTQYADLTHCHENFTDPEAHDHCVNPVCGERPN